MGFWETLFWPVEFVAGWLPWRWVGLLVGGFLTCFVTLMVSRRISRFIVSTASKWTTRHSPIAQMVAEGQSHEEAVRELMLSPGPRDSARLHQIDNQLQADIPPIQKMLLLREQLEILDRHEHRRNQMRVRLQNQGINGISLHPETAMPRVQSDAILTRELHRLHYANVSTSKIIAAQWLGLFALLLQIYAISSVIYSVVNVIF